MDVIANSMEDSLLTLGHDVINFQPVSPLERFAPNRIVMRYLRYADYARQVVKSANSYGADIQHVVDHGYAHLVPHLKSKLRICNAHDLIPLLTWKGRIEELDLDGQPIGSGKKSRKPLLNLHSLNFLKKFDHIVTISESTANDLVDYLGISNDRITVIPPALNPAFGPTDTSLIKSFRKKHDLDESIKWVMLSGREAYKNHPNAFRAIHQLSESTGQKIGIVRAGLASREFDELVNRYAMQDITRSVFLDHSELPALYSAVDCLLFPSLYEGFGMPVAEAVACGTPAVVSNRGSLPEVAGDLAVMVDPFDIVGLAEALKLAIYDNRYRGYVRQKGFNAMAKYHPHKIGQSLDELYSRLTISLND